MTDLHVWRWTGAFGVAAFILILVAQPLYLVGGTAPRLQDTISFSAYVTSNHAVILSRSLVDAFVVACFLVFLAGLRHLIRQTRPEYEWAATLVFGAGVVWAILVLVGDTFEASAALDTIGGKAEPVAVRALWEGSVVAFGAIGLILAALFLASAGYAIVATGVLPRWIGWVACLAALLSLVATPAIYAGTNATGFYTADGLASFIGLLPFLLWLLIVSIAMMVKRDAAVPMTVTDG
jgi:hypothetical protein